MSSFSITEAYPLSNVAGQFGVNTHTRNERFCLEEKKMKKKCNQLTFHILLISIEMYSMPVIRTTPTCY